MSTSFTLCNSNINVHLFNNFIRNIHYAYVSQNVYFDVAF